MATALTRCVRSRRSPKRLGLVSWLSIVLVCFATARTFAQNGQSAQNTTGTQESLVVKIYGCPAGQAAATAEQLRSNFGVFGGVQIASDERTSQVIVQAPADIQARISQRLAAAMPQPPETNAKAGEGSQTPAAPVQTRRITLQHMKTEQLGTSLWNLLGNRLSTLPTSTPKMNRYRLALFGGGRVDVTLDSAAGQAIVEGVGGIVDVCARLIEALDAQSADGGKDIHMLPFANGAVAKRAACRPGRSQQHRCPVDEHAPGGHAPKPRG